MKGGLLSRIPAGMRRETERKLVEFIIGGIRYGADIMRVREIVNPREMVPVPSAPAHVVGVADHRAKVVPVIDLRVRFGLELVESDRSKWVIVDAGRMDTALLVDQVRGVTPVSRADRRDTHPLSDVAQNRWVREVFGSDGGLVFELDLDTVIGTIDETDTDEEPGEMP